MSNTPKRSSLGVFHRSSLGVRGGERLFLNLGMVNAFCDESTPYNNYGMWPHDLAAWNSHGGAPALSSSIIIPSGSAASAAPYGIPSNMKWSLFARNPDLEDFTSQVTTEVRTYGVAYPIKFIIDTSGSMDRGTLEPGLSLFETWLDNGGTSDPDPMNPLPPLLWAEYAIGDERWLQWLEQYSYWTI